MSCSVETILKTVSSCDMEIIFSTAGCKPKIINCESYSFAILFPTNKALKPLESQYFTFLKSTTKWEDSCLLS